MGPTYSSLAMPRPLVIVQERPLNAETPLESLSARVTPVPEFYVRNHFDVPATDVAGWRLEVAGAVERPLALSLPELQAMAPRTRLVTLECAGNGRTAMSPLPPGVRWGFGAVGVAEFTGAPLAAVLERAGIRAAAREVLFEGADRGILPNGRPGGYARSLALPAALEPEVLLAWDMNGVPLTPDHGRPLRLLVPGWYGMASVKWLERITLLTEAFDGFFQRDHYRYFGEAGVPPGAPVERIRVRSLITEPIEGATLPSGSTRVTGIAWSSGGAIQGVDVSVDGGTTWHAARLASQESPFAPAHWEFEWRAAPPGEWILISRACDDAGRRQPLEPIWNEGGYGNHGVQWIRVQVD